MPLNVFFLYRATGRHVYMVVCHVHVCTVICMCTPVCASFFYGKSAPYLDSVSPGNPTDNPVSKKSS